MYSKSGKLLIVIFNVGDEEIRILKERLEETEKAMQMIVTNMAAMTSQLPKPEKSEEKVEKRQKSAKKDKNQPQIGAKDHSDDNNETEEITTEKDIDESESDSESESEIDEEILENPKVEILESNIPLAQES